MAFLEIITRFYKRPKMMRNNMESLHAQTCDDWEQTILADDVGMGVGWSYTEIAKFAIDGKLTGDYIWILDDDDMCIRNTLIDELRTIVTQENPDVIMLRMNHLERGILPSYTWGKSPKLGDIGCSAFVVRRSVFKAYAHVLDMGDYSNDYYFIAALFDNPSLKIFWHDVIASQVQWIGMGRPEAV